MRANEINRMCYKQPEFIDYLVFTLVFTPNTSFSDETKSVKMYFFKNLNNVAEILLFRAIWLHFALHTWDCHDGKVELTGSITYN